MIHLRSCLAGNLGGCIHCAAAYDHAIAKALADIIDSHVDHILTLMLSVVLKHRHLTDIV